MPSLSDYSGRTRSSHSQSSGRDYEDSRKYTDMMSPNDSDSYDDSSIRRNSRFPSTHDLAEFLRSSKPEDFKFSPSPAPTAPDDMVIFNRTPRKGLARFLRPMTPREPLENIKETPPKEKPLTISKAVKFEKTVKGKPYLAIQVDYTPSPPVLTDSFLPALSIPLSDESSKRDSFFTSGGLSSDFYPSRSSTTSTSGREPSIYSRNLLSSDGRPSASFWGNVPWNEPNESESLVYCSVCQIQHARKADHCTIPEPTILAKDPSDTLSTLSLKISDPRVRQRPESLKRLSVASSMSNLPSSVSPGLYSTMPRLSRNSSNCQRKLFASSSAHTSSLTVENDDMVKNCVKEEVEAVEPVEEKKVESPSTTLPQPGPPPSRELPSLPEAHDRAINLATKIRKISSARSLPEDQTGVSPIESTLSSQTSMPELSPRKQREALVKARKMKDLQTIQKRRDLDSSVSSVDEEVLDRARLKPFQSTNTYKNSPTVPKARASRPSRSYKLKLRSSPSPTLTPIMTVYDQQPVTAPDMSTVSSPTESVRPVGSQQCLSLLSSPDSEQPSRSQKRVSLLSSNSSSVHSFVQRDVYTSERSSSCLSRDSELELRMLNMERRNMLLEQALLAVLRGPVYNDNQIADHYRKPSLLQDLLLQSQNVPHHVSRDSRSSSEGYSLSSMHPSVVPAA